MSTNTINRRKFIRQAGIASASLAIGFNFVSCTGSQPEGIIELFKVNVNEVANGLKLNPFVFIEKTGAVTIFNHRPDMGQGTFQSVPILIAEELDIDLDKITIRQAPGNKEYGQQGVGGSTSMRTMWEPMRKMGAAAREMLVQAAAEQWKVSPVDCQTDNGFVRNAKTGEKLNYGDLVEAASQLEVPKEPKLKAVSEYRMIGKYVPKPSVNLKVAGKANFGLDMKKEGMVFALIERCPTFNGTLKSLDDSETMQVKGVQKVMKTVRKLGVNEWEGVAVIADSYYAALKGKRALKIEWDDKHTQNTEDIFKKIREKAANEEGRVFEKEGNFNRAFAKATTKMEATYETPFLAHAAMEPQNVLVDFRKDEVEIWAPTQFPQWAMRTVA